MSLFYPGGASCISRTAGDWQETLSPVTNIHQEIIQMESKVRESTETAHQHAIFCTTETYMKDGTIRVWNPFKWRELKYMTTGLDRPLEVYPNWLIFRHHSLCEGRVIRAAGECLTLKRSTSTSSPTKKVTIPCLSPLPAGLCCRQRPGQRRAVQHHHAVLLWPEQLPALQSPAELTNNQHWHWLEHPHQPASHYSHSANIFHYIYSVSKRLCKVWQPSQFLGFHFTAKKCWGPSL